MEILKLISIRLSKSSIDKAKVIASSVGYYGASEVLRVAIWLGLKCITPGVLHKLLHMKWVEEEIGVYYTLEDVIKTVGDKPGA